jgi:valyl-tRNA synthetase
LCNMVKSLYHTGELPWRRIMISGHALSADRGKLSKSRKHNEAGPMELIERESADALRYWATSVKTGSDTPFQAETVVTGRRLVTKLWNAARFVERHLEGIDRGFLKATEVSATLLPTDRWLLSALSRTISFATRELQENDYASARSEVERFFWSDLCDNYLELVKARLYGEAQLARDAARWTLYHALLAVLKLLAPYIPYVTEEIYQALFRSTEGAISIHCSKWPQAKTAWIDANAEAAGKALLEILREVRRYKAEHSLSVGAKLDILQVYAHTSIYSAMQQSHIDMQSATRADKIAIEESFEEELISVSID